MEDDGREKMRERDRERAIANRQLNRTRLIIMIILKQHLDRTQILGVKGHNKDWDGKTTFKNSRGWRKEAANQTNEIPQEMLKDEHFQTDETKEKQEKIEREISLGSLLNLDPAIRNIHLKRYKN